jgi:hypothetical protein
MDERLENGRPPEGGLPRNQSARAAAQRYGVGTSYSVAR